MIVRSLEDIRKEPGDSARNVEKEKFATRRLLLKEDGMGFALTETVLYAGTEVRQQYKNHLEAVYCIEGEGEVVDLGQTPAVTYTLKPGTMYALDKHDRHIVRAKTDVRFVVVFYPPITGMERHDADGSYPLME